MRNLNGPRVVPWASLSSWTFWRLEGPKVRGQKQWPQSRCHPPSVVVILSSISAIVALCRIAWLTLLEARCAPFSVYMAFPPLINRFFSSFQMPCFPSLAPRCSHRCTPRHLLNIWWDEVRSELGSMPQLWLLSCSGWNEVESLIWHFPCVEPDKSRHLKHLKTLRSDTAHHLRLQEPRSHSGSQGKMRTMNFLQTEPKSRHLPIL